MYSVVSLFSFLPSGMVPQSVSFMTLTFLSCFVDSPSVWVSLMFPMIRSQLCLFSRNASEGCFISLSALCQEARDISLSHC